MTEHPKRYEFTKSTRIALALRAGHICSFPGCDHKTVGPSDESPTAVSMTGKASHIHAAAPGGPRYREMSPAECKHIDNGIWMCGTHADVIDKDTVAYSPDRLREMKRQHEARIKSIHENKLRLTPHGGAGCLGNDLLLFEFWRSHIDLDTLVWHAFLRPKHLPDITINDAFIARIVRFLNTIDEVLPNGGLSPSMKAALDQFVHAAKDFITIIDEAEPDPLATKFSVLFQVEQSRGNFLYLVDTERETPWGLRPSDLIEFEKEVLKVVMASLMMTANGMILAANNLDLVKPPLSYLKVPQDDPVEVFPPPMWREQPYPGLEVIRHWYLAPYRLVTS